MSWRAHDLFKTHWLQTPPAYKSNWEGVFKVQDLGSLLQVTSGEDVEVISVEDDKFTIPSVVSYLGPDERIVGTPAKA